MEAPWLTPLQADTSGAGVMKQNLFREFVTETGTTASAMWIKDAVTRCVAILLAKKNKK